MGTLVIWWLTLTYLYETVGNYRSVCPWLFIWLHLMMVWPPTARFYLRLPTALNMRISGALVDGMTHLMLHEASGSGTRSVDVPQHPEAP